MAAGYTRAPLSSSPSSPGRALSTWREDRLVDSLLRIDSNGEIQITATIDTSSVEIEGDRYDPRLRFPAFPDVKKKCHQCDSSRHA